MNTYHRMSQPNPFRVREGWVYIAGTHSLARNKLIIQGYTINDAYDMVREHTKVYE